MEGNHVHIDIHDNIEETDHERVTNKSVEKKFLEFENPRSVFAACFELKLKHDENTSEILDQKCKDSHKFSGRIKSIGARIFNIFSKNFTAELNDKIHAHLLS